MSAFMKKKSGSSPVKTGGMFFRAKKHMASRLTDSSIGRQTVIKFFGHSGDSLLQSVQSVAEYVEGKEFAKQLMVDIMKIVGKVGLLYSNKVVSEESFEPIVPSLLEMASNLQYNLDLKDSSSRDGRAVADAFEKLHKILFNLIKDHMQEKNSAKLTHVCDYLKSSKHLDALFTDPHLEAQRITMHTHISRLVDPFSAEMEATNKNLREQSQKRFDKLSGLVANPTFPAFMRDIETRRIVTSWIMEGDSRDSVSQQHLFGCDFYVAVLDFKSITSKPILTISTEDFVRKDIFDPAVARIASLFEMLFEDSFKTCEAFEGLKEELRILELRLHIDVEEHHHEEEDNRQSVHDPGAGLGMKDLSLED
ncbi:hypothetical protein TeGR_g6588 [Tetraparma gracilis]|uniref:Uncharacterized protein n=1 Tax=Tetraparma gracilis TaxID=2962635 RepID=A0ABQ6MVL9_9STRA|nr:hypothetical protein TeGR_g6588 [Tetraparma gracilis]